MTSARKHKRRQVHNPTFCLQCAGAMYFFLQKMPAEKRNAFVVRALRKHLGAVNTKNLDLARECGAKVIPAAVFAEGEAVPMLIFFNDAQLDASAERVRVAARLDLVAALAAEPAFNQPATAEELARLHSALAQVFDWNKASIVKNPLCDECEGAGFVSGSQNHFECPKCSAPAIPELTSTASRKPAELQAKGLQINGYALQGEIEGRFTALHKRNLAGERFDDMIDELGAAYSHSSTGEQL